MTASPERDYWPHRRQEELCDAAPGLIDHWVATGSAPTLSPSGISWRVAEAFPNDDGTAVYPRFLGAIGEILARQGEPAADAFLQAPGTR